jgi:hypothetical protein
LTAIAVVEADILSFVFAIFTPLLVRAECGPPSLKAYVDGIERNNTSASQTAANSIAN